MESIHMKHRVDLIFKTGTLTTQLPINFKVETKYNLTGDFLRNFTVLTSGTTVNDGPKSERVCTGSWCPLWYLRHRPSGHLLHSPSYTRMWVLTHILYVLSFKSLLDIQLLNLRTNFEITTHLRNHQTYSEKMEIISNFDRHLLSKLKVSGLRLVSCLVKNCSI